MKKIIILIILLFPFSINALEYPDLYSENVILYDRTDDKILHENNMDKKVSIASLTKIMTTITAIEKIESLDKEIVITKDVFTGLPWDASVAGLKVGDKVTLRDLLYASILPSGADATQALAINLCGSVDNFVKEMNNLAKNIGMNNSNFLNVTGLDIETHYSTLKDLLMLLNYSLDNELFRKVYTTKEYTLSNGLVVNSTIKMYNKLMKLDTTRIIGSKTGFTNDAGLCISILFKAHNHELMLITTNAPYVYGNFYNLKDALKIIKFVDDNYSIQTLVKKDEVIYKLPVTLSKIDTYEIRAKNNIDAFLPNDADKSKFKIEYQGNKELSFNNKTNELIGNVKYLYDGKILKEEEVIVEEKIEISLKKVLLKYKKIIIFGITLLVTLVILIFIYNKRKIKRKN